MANETTGRESDKFMLRLPDGMRDRLKAEAEANKRSMNAEIVARLELTLPVPIAEVSLADPSAPPDRRKALNIFRQEMVNLAERVTTLADMLDKEAALVASEEAETGAAAPSTGVGAVIKRVNERQAGGDD